MKIADLKIGPSPGVNNIHAESDGTLTAVEFVGGGAGLTGVTGDALTPAFINALDAATPAAGDLIVGVDLTDGELKKFDIDDLPSGGGSGTVTSVAVSGSDGIEVDSGSPITTSGTIALGVNAGTLRSHINVADGANNYSHPNHSGDVTSSGDGATTIANGAVTNAKAANMAEATIKGRAAAAGTGDPTDLNGAQVRTIINVEDGATADQSNAEIETAYNAQVAAASESEMTTGTEAGIRRVSPLRVAQGIAALAPPVTLAGSPDYLSLSGQQITRNAINLASHVTGDLPLANVAQIAQNTILGRALGAGTGDITALSRKQVAALVEDDVELTSTSNSIAWNADDGIRNYYHDMTENTTVANPSGTKHGGQIVCFEFSQGATPRTLAFGSDFAAGHTFGGTIPAITTTENRISKYLFQYSTLAAKLILIAHMEH
jgi:hypothetical protein